jgi:hypothetical protein
MAIYSEKRRGGDRHPTYIDVIADREGVEVWLRVCGGQKETTSKFSEAKVIRWFEARVKNWPEGKPYPSRDVDQKDALAEFPGLSISVFRKIRKSHTPPEWQKRGPRNQKSNSAKAD